MNFIHEPSVSNVFKNIKSLRPSGSQKYSEHEYESTPLVCPIVAFDFLFSELQWAVTASECQINIVLDSDRAASAQGLRRCLALLSTRGNEHLRRGQVKGSDVSPHDKGAAWRAVLR